MFLRKTSLFYNLIPKPSFSTRNSKNSPIITANLNFFKDTFFSSTIKEWSKLNSNIRSSPADKLSKKRILEFIRSRPNSILNVPDSSGLNFVTRLHVSLSYLHKS